jgi:serine/threonine-protein kinase HipA
VLLVNAAQRYRLSPAFDVLPSGQALGYQQMRIGASGADATLENALSEHRSFALTLQRAHEICAEIALVIGKWRSHFKAHGVSRRDLDQLVLQIDRDFLRKQRKAL